MSDQLEHALIHLNVPRETKARWVRASRAEGRRLTEWIVKIVEAHMAKTMLAKITIPDDVRFAEDAAGQHHSLPPGQA